MGATGRLSNVSRIINLIYFLGSPGVRSKGGATSDEVRAQVGGYDPAQSDEAFERQFRRDRKEMASLGFPTEKEPVPGGGARWRLAGEGARQEALDLDLKDVSLLEVCARNALESPSFVMRDELAAALAKIKTTLGPVAPAGDAAGPADTDAPAQDGEPDDAQEVQHVFERVREALAGGLALEFPYRSASGAETRRSVFPLRVFVHLGDLYLLAYDLDRKATRRFKLERFAGLPEAAAASPATVEEALAHRDDEAEVLPFQYGEQRVVGKAYFSPRIAYRAQTLTRARGELADHGAGKLWTVGVADPAAFARWAVENGPGILVVEPPEAARIVREGLERASRTHEAQAAGSEVPHGAS